MRYDRLLQLGGIDRQIDPIPQYISKQFLQEEIDDLYDKISGGGGSCQPGPNTVGTEQIIDGSVIEADLNDDVKAGLHELKDPNNYAGDGDVDNIFN